MKDKKQKFGGTLKLTCKVKGDTTPKPTFRWFKDGKEIKDGSKGGSFTIRTRGLVFFKFILPYIIYSKIEISVSPYVEIQTRWNEGRF